MTIQVISLDRPGAFRLATQPAPEAPGPNEALVRVHAVGVCGTDIHAFYGRQPFFEYPRILGHELGVEIVAVGPNEAGLAPGDRCSVEPYLNCGACVACRQGRTNCCVKLLTLGVHTDGGMRELIALPVNKLHRSAALSYEQLALVETLAIGCHAVNRAQLREGEWALVIGAGPIGLATMQFAHLAGARVIALDISPRRLEFCRAQGTADYLVEGGDGAPAEIERLTGGEMATAVFDATGSLQSMARAFDYAAHTARITLVGLAQGDVSFHDPSFHRRELTINATRNAVAADFRRIIDLIERGRIDTQPWITHRATPRELVADFEQWQRPEAGLVKAMVAMAPEAGA
jgi:2-desacetyl-2-hydroxyethyl bacteriochlorophyllide A dehydrogenase